MGVTAFLGSKDGSYTEIEMTTRSLEAAWGATARSMNPPMRWSPGYQRSTDRHRRHSENGERDGTDEIRLFGSIFGDFSGDGSLGVLLQTTATTRLRPSERRRKRLRPHRDHPDLSYQDQVADINQDGLDDT